MNAIKKMKRRFSLKEKHNDPDYSADEADEEANAHLQKEIDDAEKHGHDTGKPGSFLNKLISHGNKKTEEQLRREQEQNDGVIR